ncbi:hypothetical protein F4821DRAFT_237380 [Hypoxylon rubiginosum]|uniref:Uncharacterized protein n=1 Tax=Hypoxylon rubiginosum TaxID=110542 RepID=A0ACC0D2P3_9PEZI|nr:hypothetical protein F4821DRAFT_237380 [Hypoxylon rubiginosum]
MAFRFPARVVWRGCAVRGMGLFLMLAIRTSFMTISMRGIPLSLASLLTPFVTYLVTYLRKCALGCLIFLQPLRLGMLVERPGFGGLMSIRWILIGFVSR